MKLIIEVWATVNSYGDIQDVYPTRELAEEHDYGHYHIQGPFEMEVKVG